MPLTLSHPAAAVPLARWGLILSALVVGSISPDFLYFYCLSTRCQFGHTLLGIFLFDIPAGLVILWIFHRILKQPLFSLFPISHQQRLIPFVNEFQFFPLRRFLLIIVSLLIGTLTHIIWDSFTHYSGWVVQQLPILISPVIEIGQKTIRFHHILQHGSTLLGAALLLYWYMKWYRLAQGLPDNKLTPLSNKMRWQIILFIGLSAGVLGSIYGYLHFSPFSSFRSLHIFIQYTVIASITIVFIELVIFSIFWHFLQKQSTF